MAPLIHLLAISSLAVLACSFGPSPVNALATDIHHIRDVSALGHGAMARRKRATSNNSRRCKQRPSSSTSTPKSTSAKAKSEPSTTAHSTAKKPASTPASSGNSGGGKIGLAWANGDAQSIKPFLNSKVEYIYTWSPSKPSNVEGLTFMPMLWGPKQVPQFQKLVKQGYANVVMGFNEPEQPGQSNISPEYGAQLWKQFIQPLESHGYDMMVAPATSSAPSGMTWMKDWFKACNGGCKPTHMACHYYDVTAEGLIKYLELWHDTFKLDILLTEFACQNYNGGSQCSESDVQKFVEAAVSFVNSTPWMKAAFPFGAMKDMQGVNNLDQLMSSSGQPTALWQKFINP